MPILVRHAFGLRSPTNPGPDQFSHRQNGRPLIRQPGQEVMAVLPHGCLSRNSSRLDLPCNRLYRLPAEELCGRSREAFAVALKRGPGPAFWGRVGNIPVQAARTLMLPSMFPCEPRLFLQRSGWRMGFFYFPRQSGEETVSSHNGPSQVPRTSKETGGLDAQDRL